MSNIVIRNYSVAVRICVACGGSFHTPNGTIKYPESNATLQYKPNMNCGWFITVERSFVLNITFDWIDVENSTGCHYDSVMVTISIGTTRINVSRTVFSNSGCFRSKTAIPKTERYWERFAVKLYRPTVLYRTRMTSWCILNPTGRKAAEGFN